MKPADLKLLHGVQRRFEDTYDIPQQLDIADYLITNRAQAQALAGRNLSSSDEHLLIDQSHDALALSLFIDAPTLQRVHSRNTDNSLQAATLADWCTILEGMSHLLYSAFNALRDRSFSALELELQAEVDKFTMLVIDRLRHDSSSQVARCHRQLFVNVRFAEQAETGILERYQTANHLAARYCKSLHKRFLENGNFQQWFNELREFYRRSQGQKLRRIAELNPY